MRLVRRLWHELTRPRGNPVHRFYRVGRGSRSGVAILIVLTCFLFLTMSATEIASTSLVRIKLAANLRDEARAEALARSGLNFYRLILIAANGLDQKANSMAAMFPQLQQMGISGDMLWQMVPMINTNLLRMVFVNGGDLDEDEQARIEAQGGLTEEQRQESMEAGGGTKPGFLDFQGDFFAEVEDETRRINIKNIQGRDVAELNANPAARQVLGLLQGNNTCEAIRNNRPMSTADLEDNTQWLRDRDLEPLELVSNLADWVDKDSNRAFPGGNEDALYERLDEPYRVKNGPFDSLEEVRLVEGWHRDDVWDKYGNELTVFGDGKVNVNTADCEVLFALLRSTINPPPPDPQIDSCVRAIEAYRMIVPFGSEQSFVQFLQNGSGPPMPQTAGASANALPQGQCNLQPSPELQQAISTKTKVFRVTSVGTVGDAKVTIEAVFDFSSSTGGQTLYWRID